MGGLKNHTKCSQLCTHKIANMMIFRKWWIQANVIHHVKTTCFKLYSLNGDHHRYTEGNIMYRSLWGKEPWVRAQWSTRPSKKIMSQGIELHGNCLLKLEEYTEHRTLVQLLSNIQFLASYFDEFFGSYHAFFRFKLSPDGDTNQISISLSTPRWWFQIFFYFHLYLGKMNPFWLAFFFKMGWFNHQPDSMRI